MSELLWTALGRLGCGTLGCGWRRIGDFASQELAEQAANRALASQGGWTAWVWAGPRAGGDLLMLGVDDDDPLVVSVCKRVSQITGIAELDDGAARLLAYRKTQKLSLREAGKELGSSHVVVRSWELRLATPREVFRKAIETWSGGAVPASSWTTSATESRIKASTERAEQGRRAERRTA